MLTTTRACVTTGSYLAARDSSLESKMNTGVPAGGASRLTRSIPGRNHQAAGTGGEESTGTDFPIGSRGRETPGTDFPIGSRVSARASAGPNVSPSASLWVTAMIIGASSITCQIRGAISATSGRDGASSVSGVWLPSLDFPQELADTDAVSDSQVELETQVGGEP